MAEYRVRITETDHLARELLDALAARAEVKPIDAVARRVLVLGGARSGKSSWAEKQFLGREIDYVATSFVDPSDAEWLERVRIHRNRRPAHWHTVETMELAELLSQPGRPLLVDCLAVWLARVLDEAGAWQEEPGWQEKLGARVDELVSGIRDTEREVIFVSNEVGSGVVPATPAGRLYRDELGRLNTKVASACDQLWIVVAGVPRRLK